MNKFPHNMDFKKVSKLKLIGHIPLNSVSKVFAEISSVTI